MNIVEIIGYLGSVFVIASFLFKDLLKVRIVNFIGCLCFVVYGFLLSEEPLWPVIIPNSILSVVQCYFVIRDRIQKR